MLGGTLIWSTPSSAGIRCGKYVLAVQRVEGYSEPQWPGSAILHLDPTGHTDVDVESLVGVAVAAGRESPNISGIRDGPSCWTPRDIPSASPPMPLPSP